LVSFCDGNGVFLRWRWCRSDGWNGARWMEWCTMDGMVHDGWDGARWMVMCHDQSRTMSKITKNLENRKLRQKASYHDVRIPWRRDTAWTRRIDNEQIGHLRRFRTQPPASPCHPPPAYRRYYKPTSTSRATTRSSCSQAPSAPVRIGYSHGSFATR
jgi:hypothetical protein